MLLVTTFVCVFVLQAVNGNRNAYLDCANIGGQLDVSIDQLLGLWYGMEIITHREDRAVNTQEAPERCLKIKIEDDTTETPTNPSYINYNSGQHYGSRYPGYDYDTTTTSSYQYRKNQERYQNKQHYKKDGQYFDQRNLVIYWIEDNYNPVKYTTSYMSAPSVWDISGPYNGSALIEPMASFAGKIQVLKAVNDHLVLTFCFKKPDRQLYTVILSRQETLRKRDILAVHNMLTKKGLKIVSIEKVCLDNGTPKNVVTNSLILVLFSLYSLLLC